MKHGGPMKNNDTPLLSSLAVELLPISGLQHRDPGECDSPYGHAKTDVGTILDTIEKACFLGAEKITLLDENPDPVPYMDELLDRIQTRQIKAEVLTCGTGINADTARRFMDRKLDIILTDPARSAFEPALGHLLNAGYPTPDASLAVHAPITRNGMDGLRPLWRRARNNRIVPLFEIRSPGNEDIDSGLPEPGDIRDLFEDLARIDAIEYDIHWVPCPPVAGPFIPSFLLCPVLTPSMDIHPVKGLPVSLGNVRDTGLETIVKDSEVLENLSQWRVKIKGPCRTCEHIDRCFGSRPLAWRITGDYMASDPTCWKNTGKTDQITYLPVSADRIIPQQHPMRLVSRLLKVEERYAEVEAVVNEKSPFAKADGSLEDVALFEMMAQAAAAMNGFEEFDTGLPPHRGALLGGKNIRLKGTGSVGAPLLIKIRKKASFGNFGVIGATVHSGKTLLAQGDIKVFKESL